MQIKDMHKALDQLVEQSLRRFARVALKEPWHGKEQDWVNRYAHGTLLKYCDPAGPLHDASQIGIEVGIPQPPDRTEKMKSAVRRDLIIWDKPESTCWDSDWKPVRHPLAILEWKVHRPGHRNPKVQKERKWLRWYCGWQQNVVAYAVEIDTAKNPIVLKCARFLGKSENESWLILNGDA